MSQRTPTKQQNSGSNSQQTPTPGKSTGKFSGNGSGSRPRSANSSYSPNLSLGGTTLTVEGMGSPRNKMPSASYRSGSSIGDAHIKALSQQIHKVPFKSPPSSAAGPRSPVAFGSTSGSDRDAHYKDMLKRVSNNRGSPLSWGQPGGQCSASYRSKSPIACAHIKAFPGMSDSKYSPGGDTFSRQQESPAYRSKTSIADAHIKALRKPYDHNPEMADISKGVRGGGASSGFMSNTTIADAHIKALPKVADVCVTYRDEE